MTPTPAELLYHTTITVVDYHDDTSGSKRVVYVLGTHATLQAAKKFAASALHTLNYEPEDFVIYEGHQPGKHWRHGDGVVVFAKAPAGQEFLIGIDTKPNDLGLIEGSEGTIVLPQGVPHLHYVLQTKIDYHQDRSGASQSTEIEGCYFHREDAFEAAYNCLSNQKDEFVEYDRRDSLELKDEWPFGDDVLVHAVSLTGENYTVAVRTAPSAHKKHGKEGLQM